MVEGPLCVGFLGVGTISAAIVDSILSAPNAEQVDILLSPRSTSRSAELAARHERVRIAAHNQAVVDASDIVVIAVLPAQVADLCAALTFRADQVIVSVAAGWPPSLLSERVEPASTVCQMIPLPMIGVHAGPLVLYPRVVAIEQLLEGCGEIVTPDREEDIIVLNCVSSTMSTFFKFQETLIDWSVQQGLDPEIARDYVVAYFHGLTTESTKSKVIDMSEMVKEHETPRGLNEYLRRSLSEAGTFAELGRHLDHLHKTRDHAKLRKRGDGANA